MRRNVRLFRCVTLLSSKMQKSLKEGTTMKIYKGFQKMWFLILLLVALMAGCASNGGDPGTLVSIAVTPATTSIPVTGTLQYTVLALYGDGSARDVTATSSWASGTTGVTFGSTTGLATGAIANVIPVVITVTYQDKTTTAALTVNVATSSSFKVTPALASIPVTGSQQYTVTETFSDGSTFDRTAVSAWTSANLPIGGAAVATVSSSLPTKGVVTGNIVGKSIITATFGSMSGSATVTVNAAKSVAFTVTPQVAFQPITGTRPYTALETFSDGSTIDRTAVTTWSAPDLVGTGVATITPSGVATAVSAGQATITATYNGKTATAVLTVNATTSVSFTVTPQTASQPISGTRSYTALETFSDGSTVDRTAIATWTSPDLVGIGVASILPTGIATGNAAGQATITARYNGKTATAIFTVNATTSTSFTVTPQTSSQPITGHQPFTALESFSDGSTVDRTAVATWTSPDLVGVGVASILPTGIATGNAAGQATITARYNGKTATAILTVNPTTSVSFTVTPVTASIPISATRTYTALETFSDGSTIDRTAVTTWSAPDLSGTGVAAILPSGIATGNSAGQATVTAIYNGKTATAVLTVNPLSAVSSASLTVTPATASIPISGTRTYTALETFSDGSTADRTAVATWSAPDLSGTGVAAILSNGTAIGTSAGQATITANYNGRTATAVLTVKPATSVSFTVTPATASIPISGTTTYTALETFSNGSTADRTAIAIWTASDISGSGVAAILPNGTATGLAAGQSTISATYNGRTATAVLTVSPAVIPNPGPAGVVNLGTAATYGVMSYSAMTLSAPAKSHIYGDVGIYFTSTFIGFTLAPAAPPTAASPTSPNVTGQISSGPSITTGYNSGNFAAMITAFNGLQAAWIANNTTNKPPPAVNLTAPLATSPLPAGGTFTAAGQDMTGMILGPGIYASNNPFGTLALSNASGPLVLDAGGNPDAVYIFQASDITTTSGSVILRNGAQSKNVYWVLTNTATIGNGTTATTFQGTILAGAAVTVGTDTSVQGRVLAGASLTAGALTINGGVITVP
jgi:hypothetical protein